MAAYAIQFRRGTTTQHNSFTGLLGEVTVDTDKKTLVVHDGSTTGGFPLAREGANLASAEGSFTSNVSVGGTFSVTSTASFGDDVTITGDLGMTGHIIPSANITYDLGSTTMMWRDIYVGPGSLYVNGKKVIEDNAGTINITTDVNQNLKVETTGTGSLQLSSAAGISVNGEVNALTGDLQFGDHLDMNSNRIKEVSAPVDGTDAANKNYVDTKAAAVLAAGTSSFDGVDGDFSGNVEISGNLTVTGTTTTVNAETIELADNILLLNSNASGTASQNGGIEIERGDDLNVQFLWDETNNRWSIGSEDFYSSGSVIADVTGNLTGDVTGTVSSLSNHDTDDLAEGSNLYWTTARGNANFTTNLAASDTDDLAEGSNLYFTTARANTAFDARLATKSTTDLSEGSNLYWTTARGDANFSTNLAASDTDDLSEGTNLYWTTARGNANFTTNLAASNTDDLSEGTNLYFTTSRANSAFDTRLATKDTDDLSEGAGNLYFTDVRARGAISVSGDLQYNNSTGAMSFTQDKAFSSLTGVPTTVSGYGITDAYTKTEVDGLIAGKDNSDEITEGSSNLYFTDARARSAISVSGDLAYNASTGAISFTQDKAFSSLTGKPTTVSGYGITDAYTKTEVDSAITTAVQGKDNSDEITEGSSNLYFTDARARGAISVSGDLAYNSSTGAISFTERTDAEVRGLLSASGDLQYNASTGALSFTQNKAFSALTGVPTTVSGYGITDAYTKSEVNTLIAGKDNSDEITEGSSNLYFTNARAVAAVKSALSMTHTGVYVVTASDDTGNTASSHAISAATLGFDLSGKEFYQVYLNRQLLRPTEYTVNSSNGTVTFSADVIATDDEIEAVIYG